MGILLSSKIYKKFGQIQGELCTLSIYDKEHDIPLICEVKRIVDMFHKPFCHNLRKLKIKPKLKKYTNIQISRKEQMLDTTELELLTYLYHECVTYLLSSSIQIKPKQFSIHEIKYDFDLLIFSVFE